MNLFGVLMAAFMVYGMEVYNAILRCGGFVPGMLLPTAEVIALIPVVMVIQACFGGPASAWLLGKLLKGRSLLPRQQILARQAATVLFMCPAMSLVAVFVFKGGLQPEILRVWGQTILLNLPMAFLWQVMVVGPVVRGIASRN